MLHDAFKLACEELLDPIIALELTKYLSKERDFIPWAMVRSRSECISMMLQDKSIKIKYKVFITKRGVVYHRERGYLSQRMNELRIFTQDSLFNAYCTVINEGPAIEVLIVCKAPI